MARPRADARLSPCHRRLFPWPQAQGQTIHRERTRKIRSVYHAHVDCTDRYGRLLEASS